MKNLIALILIASLASCNFGKKVVNYAKNNCVSTNVYNSETGITTAYYECDSLWSAKQIKQHVRSAEICVEVTSGKVSGKIEFDSTSALSKDFKLNKK